MLHTNVAFFLTVLQRIINKFYDTEGCYLYKVYNRKTIVHVRGPQ